MRGITAEQYSKISKPERDLRFAGVWKVSLHKQKSCSFCEEALPLGWIAFTDDDDDNKARVYSWLYVKDGQSDLHEICEEQLFDDDEDQEWYDYETALEQLYT